VNKIHLSSSIKQPVRKANANAQRATTGDSGLRDVTCTSLIDNAGEQDPPLPAQVHWGEFKAYLNKNEQWLAKKDIPVYMSSLIAFSRSQLEALADAEGMTASASASNSGELKSLTLSTATRQIPKAPAQHAHSAVAITRSLNAVVYKT
jgi:hypothetical protein